MTLDNNTTFWLWLGFTGMLIGALTILSFWGRFNPKHRYHVAIAFLITLIASVAYYVMATGHGTIEVGDKTVFYARYVDWILTTPLLLLSLVFVGLPAVSDPSKKRQRTRLISALIVSDIAMIVTGAIANITSPIFDKTVWYVVSVGLLLFVLWMLFGRVRQEAKRYNLKSYMSLLTFLTVLWVLYPVVWLIGNSELSLISTSSEAAIYAILDVTAKSVFGVILLVSLLGVKGKKSRS